MSSRSFSCLVGPTDLVRLGLSMWLTTVDDAITTDISAVRELLEFGDALVGKFSLG